MTVGKKLIARVVDILELDKRGPMLALMVGAKTYLIAAPLNQKIDRGDIFLVDVDVTTLREKIGSAESGGWTTENDTMRWRAPGPDGMVRYDALLQRHTIRRIVRGYFDGEDFLEVDVPLLVRGTTPDAHIKSFGVDDRYLCTSTEYQIKRLQVGGFDRLYSLTQNFRQGDSEGPYRNPEFTMLEWARSGAGLEAIEADAEQLVYRSHLALGGEGTLLFNGNTIDVSPPFARLDVRDAIGRTVRLPKIEYTLSSLNAALSAAGIDIKEADREDIGFVFSNLMEYIQPTLGLRKPVFLQNWPAFETSSAADAGEEGVALRSELFVAGVEISDGFPSNTSANLQKANFAYQQDRRRVAGMPTVTLDDKYTAALASGMPAGAGMALGFDRLVMVLTGRRSIRDVIAFAWDEL